ncbi:TPA: citrate lyase holo-ACP synthase, partial [Streptococcus pyogenes]|nr:citrate lyase holo-ACP synthase [Streptococcus pyogenes]
MCKDTYFSGEAIQLSDMLRAREERALRQLHLLKEYPE